jgi:two-component system, NarL family, invasion response regulator UvrY
MRILIVDDHAMVREGLKRILAGEFPNASFGEAANTTEALTQLWQQPWELVLLDVSMRGRSGLDVLKEIRASTCKVPVLVLSAHPEEQYALRALKSGAAGYLTKESVPQELCRAVRKVCSGGKYITPTLAEQLAAEVQSSSRPAHESLSNREYQVMLLIAAGKVPKEIGDELSLSVKTVGTYRTRVLEKLKLKNNAELMRFVMERGLS